MAASQDAASRDKVAAQPLLEVRDIRIEFATRHGPLLAIDGVSMTIEAGEIVGVVGESGAGKSLTGSAIIGLLDPPGYLASGEIVFDGVTFAYGGGAGGVRDIVTPATGVLLPTDAGPDVLASQLQHFRTGPMATAEFRAGVRRFWETHFRAEESFGRFCDRIIAMHEARRLR